MRGASLTTPSPGPGEGLATAIAFAGAAVSLITKSPLLAALWYLRRIAFALEQR